MYFVGRYKVNLIHHVGVHSLQEMAKRNAEEDKEVVIKEAICPECGKKLQRQTDADRHFDMKLLLIKHDCHQCGTTLGSISALRRHLNPQHQVKLSTRPGALSPNQWRFIPIDETTPRGDMRGTSARRETVQSEPDSQEVRTTQSMRTGSSTVTLPQEEVDARRSNTSVPPVVVRFDDDVGYTVASDSRHEPMNTTATGRFTILSPTEIEEREGRNQLQEWRAELLAAPLPIDKELWLTRWRERSPRLGFATMLAAEAMLDVFIAVPKTNTMGRETSGVPVARRGAVPVRLRVCTELQIKQRSSRYQRSLPRRSSVPAAEGRANPPLAVASEGSEEMETETMRFTVLTTAEPVKDVVSAGTNIR